jgi:hypothetical protein
MNLTITDDELAGLPPELLAQLRLKKSKPIKTRAVSAPPPAEPPAAFSAQGGGRERNNEEGAASERSQRSQHIPNGAL